MTQRPLHRRRPGGVVLLACSVLVAGGIIPQRALAAAVVGGPVRHPAARHPYHHGVAGRTVIVAPVRPIPRVRPWYWGSVVAGITIGTVIVVSAANVAPPPPSPDLCWFWTDNSRTRGYWSYCVAPRQ